MKRAVASLVASVACGATLVGAVEPRPLPAFTVASFEGAAVASSALAREGQWLLVYVRPQSSPARAALGALEKARSGAAATSVVIVVGGDAEAARALAGQYPGLSQASWYVDPDGAAFRALRLAGVPMFLGLRASGIEWSLAGVAPDRKTLTSVLSSW